MRMGMLILGLIGALIGLGGSAVTMIGGFGGTAVGVLAENEGTASGGAFVFWSGAMALIVNLVALITSVTGGVAKKRNTALVFAIATLVCGLLGIYLYNWFSGFLILVAGGLGIAGAKDVADDQQPLKKSVLLHVTSVVLVLLTLASVLIKNGQSFTAASQATAVEAPAEEGGYDVAARAAESNAEAPAAAGPDLPFVGKRSFNFEGGNGTGRIITISEDGQALVELDGMEGRVTEYQGAFSNPLPLSGSDGLLFQDGKVYQTSQGSIAKSCREEGQDCVSDLYEL